MIEFFMVGVYHCLVFDMICSIQIIIYEIYILCDEAVMLSEEHSYKVGDERDVTSLHRE